MAFWLGFSWFFVIILRHQSYNIMKKLRLYTLLALLLMAGGVNLKAQNDSYFTYEDPNFRFSEGGPCLEVGSNDSKNHFFLASAFDFSYDWFAYEQEHNTPARILKLSPEMELLGEMVIGEDGRRSTVTGIHHDPENEDLFLAVGKIHDNDLHYDKPFMVRFDADLNIVWQKEVELPHNCCKFFFKQKSFMDSQNDIVYMTEFYDSSNPMTHPYLYLRLSSEGDVMAIDSTQTALLTTGGIFEYLDGSGDYGVCNSSNASIQRLNRNFEPMGQRNIPYNIHFENADEILLMSRYDRCSVLSMPDSSLFIAADGNGWFDPEVVPDAAVLMKLSPSDTLFNIYVDDFDGLFLSDCYDDYTETVAEIKGLDILNDNLFLCYGILDYEPGGGMVGNSAFCVTKLTTGLDVIWQQVYDFNNRIMPRYVMATQDGGCLVTGEIGTGLNGEEGMMMFAVKIDSEGYLDVAEAENPVQYGECYPNPGTNVLNIRTVLQNAWVEVYDTNGRLIHSQALTENVTAIGAEDWVKGVYVWKVMANSKEAGCGKWIKE